MEDLEGMETEGATETNAVGQGIWEAEGPERLVWPDDQRDSRGK